jgi:hypothetical protein
LEDAVRTQLPFALLAALSCSLATAPVYARARTFVASYGNDSNPCTFGSPCKTFQQAVNVVDIGGEVTAIDSAGFGPINITQSVTITSPPGVEAGIVPTAGGDAITIDALTDINVTLRGLTLEGSTGGNHGIFLTSMVTAATLNILDCMVKDFTAGGIVIQPKYPGPGFGHLYLFISNTSSMNNGLDGININPTDSAVVDGTITQTAVANNHSIGFNIDGRNPVTISNSVATLNGDVGIQVQNLATLTLRDSISQNNAGAHGDVYVTNSGALYLFHNNTIDNLNNNGSVVISDGTNDINIIAGGPLSKQGLQ